MAESRHFEAAVTGVTESAALTADDLRERPTWLACVVTGFAKLELDRRRGGPVVDVGTEPRFARVSAADFRPRAALPLLPQSESGFGPAARGRV